MPPPELLVVGAASRDVEPRDPRGWRLGGGVSYGSLAAARLGARVRALVGVDAEAAGAWELDVLRAARADVRLVPLAHGPVFENRQTPAGRLQLVRQASDPLPIASLPAEWRTAPAFLLAPVAAELGDEWASVPSESAFVALAWQGLFRRLSSGGPVEHRPLAAGPLLARADVGLVSGEDAAAGGAPLAELLPRVGQQLAVTRGELGALHLERVSAAVEGFRLRMVPAIPVLRPGDPTGAGDVFLAAWCAARLAAESAGKPYGAWRALAAAAAAGSCTVEGFSLADVPGLRAVCERLLRPPPAVARPL